MLEGLLCTNSSSVQASKQPMMISGVGAALCPRLRARDSVEFVPKRYLYMMV